MDKLDMAIAAFGDETNNLTLGERVSLLRDALLWNAYETIKRVKKHGTKSPISEEEHYKQVECMKQYKEIEKMYASTLKMNKILGKTDEKMNQDFMKTIRDMKSSLGGIVRKLGDEETGRVADGV